MACCHALPAGGASGDRAQSYAWIDFDGTIKGQATDFKHMDWIDIEGFDISGGLAQGQIGEFAIRKKLDRASSQMFLRCAEGTRFPKATLDLDQASATKETRLARLELEDVWLTSQATSGAAGADSVSESVGLAFRKITYTYIQPDSNLVSEAVEYFSAGGGGAEPDSDADGMPDAWESLYGLNVGTNDAGGDLDGDGLTNLQEFQLGTHPNSGTSFFKAQLSPDPATPGLFQLTWNSVAGKVHVIEWSPDLKTPLAQVRVLNNETWLATNPDLLASRFSVPSGVHAEARMSLAPGGWSRDTIRLTSPARLSYDGQIDENILRLLAIVSEGKPPAEMLREIQAKPEFAAIPDIPERITSLVRDLVYHGMLVPNGRPDKIIVEGSP